MATAAEIHTVSRSLPRGLWMPFFDAEPTAQHAPVSVNELRLDHRRRGTSTTFEAALEGRLGR